MADEHQLGPGYLLHEEIGQGASAVVRRATARTGGPELAAVLFRPGPATADHVREVFRREEAALRDLRHPSIVETHDLVTEPDRLVLVTEFVDGPNLRRYLSDHAGVLLPAEAAGIAAQAAAALAAAHAQGVLHLNLTPEKILVVAGSHPTAIKISDFGVSALLREAGVAVPASPYTAPEVAANGMATAAADVYALGVIFAQTLSGVRPEAVHSALPTLPPALAPIVGRMLSADPRQRPSAGSAAAQLRSATAAEPPTSSTTAQPTATPPYADAQPDASSFAATPSWGASEPIFPAAPDQPGPTLGFGRNAPSRNSRWTRTRTVTASASAVALAATAALLVVTLGDRGNDRPTATPPPATVMPRAGTAPVTVDPTTADPATADPVATETLAQPQAPKRGTYAAHLPNKAGTLYVAVRDGQAIAYMCDGKRIEAWFKGPATDGSVALTGKNGAELNGTYTSGEMTGQVRVKGRTYDYDVPSVRKPSGLYRAAAKVRNAEVKGGWIVLSDGSQVGVLTIGDSPQPAPLLNTSTGTTEVGGSTVTATEISTESGAGF